MGDCNLDKKIESLQNQQQEVFIDIEEIQKSTVEDNDKLDHLLQEVNDIASIVGRPTVEFQEITIEDLNHYIEYSFPNNGKKTIGDKQYEMQNSDYVVATLAGGIAVIIDAFLVKIPKDTTIIRSRIKIQQNGSPITAFFRNIGIDENEKACKWVKTLEKWFKVPYDKSIDVGIPGMFPKSHRLHSLSHDPSISGLIWSIKDIITGTFSCIDKNGCLHIEKVAEADFSKLLTAPLIWLGHILSDVFTKMGIPIPGWSYLQLLQFGSLGEKQRTIAEVTRYMYLDGYDLRHLASMSTVNAVIEIIVRMYYYLVCKKSTSQFNPVSEKEYVEIKNNIKLHNMLFVSYAIATCGNIAKICAYQGNPGAFNLPVWIAMIKEAIAKAAIQVRNCKEYEKAIEGRHIIDENFEYLYSVIKTNKSQ